MELNEKMEKLAEAMDMAVDDLSPEQVLADLDCWDSMTRLSLIVMMDDDLNKVLSGDQIRAFKTVQDILDFME